MANKQCFKVLLPKPKLYNTRFERMKYEIIGHWILSVSHAVCKFKILRKCANFQISMFIFHNGNTMLILKKIHINFPGPAWVLVPHNQHSNPGVCHGKRSLQPLYLFASVRSLINMLRTWVRSPTIIFTYHIYNTLYIFIISKN